MGWVHGRSNRTIVAPSLAVCRFRENRLSSDVIDSVGKARSGDDYDWRDHHRSHNEGRERQKHVGELPGGPLASPRPQAGRHRRRPAALDRASRRPGKGARRGARGRGCVGGRCKNRRAASSPIISGHHRHAGVPLAVDAGMRRRHQFRLGARQAFAIRHRPHAGYPQSAHKWRKRPTA